MLGFRSRRALRSGVGIKHTHTRRCRRIHIAVAGHHLMLVLYGRLTFQPACVFRGLNKGLNCVCVFRAGSAGCGSVFGRKSTAVGCGTRPHDSHCPTTLFVLLLCIALVRTSV